MPRQMTRPRVLLLADGALVRPFPRVRKHVFAQIARRRIAVSARRTRMRRLVRVNVHVSFDGTRFRESFLADGTLIRTLPGVYLLMPSQVTVTAELFMTHSATVNRAWRLLRSVLS